MIYRQLFTCHNPAQQSIETKVVNNLNEVYHDIHSWTIWINTYRMATTDIIYNIKRVKFFPIHLYTLPYNVLDRKKSFNKANELESFED